MPPKLAHHIYEYNKGIRKLILMTSSIEELECITNRLEIAEIEYFVQKVTESKVNIYMGASECIEMIKSFDIKDLTQLSPEKDFILGTLLGYDLSQQCKRYLKTIQNEQKPETCSFDYNDNENKIIFFQSA